MADNSNKYRSAGRWWVWIPLFILVFLAGIRYSLVTAPVHHWVKSRIIQTVNDGMDGTLTIGRVSGDLWKEIRLDDVVLQVDGDTLGRVDTLYARYNIYSLMGPRVEIHLLRAEGPDLTLMQTGKGLWAGSASEQEEPVAEAYRFRVDRLVINGGRLKSHLPDWTDIPLQVDALSAESSIAYDGDSYKMDLERLRFLVSQTGLAETVTVRSSGSLDGQQVTLEQLVLATGASLVQSAGQADLSDSTFAMNITGHPLSWNDLTGIIGEYPVREDLQVNVRVKGNRRKADVSVDMTAEHMERIQLEAALSYVGSPVVESLRMKTGRLDLAALTGHSDYPTLESGQLEMRGALQLDSYRDSDFKATYRLSQFRIPDFKWDEITGSVALDRNHMKGETELKRGKEQVDFSVTVREIWNERPAFDATAVARHLDTGYWTGSRDWAGEFSARIELRGRGLNKSSRDWVYRITGASGTIAGQPVQGFESSGKVKGDSLATRSVLTMGRSRIYLNAGIARPFTEPVYSYTLNTKSLDLSEFRGMENFSTSIRATVTGEGENFSAEKLRLNSTIRIDSSIVNNEWLEQMSATVWVEDTLLHVSQASLSSAIADGSFSGRMHLLRLEEPNNRLNFTLSLKDIESLSPLIEVGRLQLEGEVTGQLKPEREGNLNFNGSVQFRNVSYNDNYYAETIDGKVEMLVVDEPEFNLDLDIGSPTIHTVDLQDIILDSRGRISDSRVAGDIEVFLNYSGEDRIQHRGSFVWSRDSLLLETNDLQIVNRNRKLGLTEPFDLVYSGTSFRIDTLRLNAEEGSYLETAVLYADSLTQRGYLEAQKLYLSDIQNTLLGRIFINGRLSGRIEVDRRDTLLRSSGEMRLSRLEYKDSEMDSVNLSYEIEDGRLSGQSSFLDDGIRIASGTLSVPFKLGDPKTFGESFFNEPVDGTFEIRPVQLNRFREMLVSAGIENTDGILRTRGNIGGTAGHPELNGELRLTEARVSGIAVDSLFASAAYDHDRGNLDVRGGIYSLRQQAAEVIAVLPVSIDLRSFSVDLPDSEDPVDIEIETNDFNLAALDDFLDRDQLQALKGRMNGSVAVKGTFGKPLADGRLTLTGGGIRVVKAGVNIGEVESSVSFRGEMIQISRFSARSGNGNLYISGTCSLNELRPDRLNLEMTAENFRIASTRDYSGSINMKSRIEGTLMKPRVSGTVRMVSGYMYLRNFGEKSVERVNLDSLQSGDEGFAIYDSLTLDMDLSFNRRFFVRTQRFMDMEIELEGTLDLQKEAGQQLQLYGTLSGVRGYARPFGKRFVLEESSVTFTGEPTNPNLNVRTLFEPPQPEAEVKIWYVIEGTVESPKFKYESSPPMELQNIISYTLFGKPFYALASWKQVVASSGTNASTELATEVIMDKVESLATRKLGLDVVQIDNTRSTGDSGTAVKTGWYLSPRTFFAIQKVVTGPDPGTKFILEYLLRENLKLIISQGGDNREGIDLLWEYNY